MKMRNKADSIFLILGTVLILAALSLFLYNRRENAAAEQASEELSVQLQEQIREIQQQDKTTETAAEENADPTPTPEAPIDTTMTVTTIDSHDFIGTLSIPKAGLVLPVMSEWDYSNLQISPCRYTGSTKSDDLVICAHNFDCHFGVLKDLSAGDEVTFTDMDGKTWYYSVATVETLAPTAIEDMISGEYALTLFTCTYGGATRVTVRCERIN